MRIVMQKSEYSINRSKFIVQYGSLTKINADVLVSSDDNYLSMSGGVSACIRDEGGTEIVNAARKAIPLSVGDVAVTTAGKLTARFIFHAVTIDYDKMLMPNEEIIRAATRKCMTLAESLEIKHIAFPALGTGVGRFPFSKAAEIMTKTISEHLLGDTKINIVTLALYERESVTNADLNIFYENAVAVASLLSQGRRLNSLLTDMRRIIRGMNQPNLLLRLQELEKEIQDAQGILDVSTSSAQRLSTLPNESGINELAGKAVRVAERINDQISKIDPRQKMHEQRELELMVLRTKLTGLLTQINVKYANLNKLQLKAANYGAEFEVPLSLENAIDSVKLEISETEATAASIRQEISKLVGS